MLRNHINKLNIISLVFCLAIINLAFSQRIKPDGGCIPVSFAGGQPTSQTICATGGDSAIFTVKVTGTPGVYYQWQSLTMTNGQWIVYNIQDGGNNPAFSGSKTSSLKVKGATSNLYLRCEASNCSPIIDTSNIVTLNVISHKPIEILSETPTVCQNHNITLTAFASGDSLSYQWEKNGLNINNATNSTLTIDSITVIDSTAYACFISNVCGSVLQQSPVNVLYYFFPVVDPIQFTKYAGDTMSFSAFSFGHPPLYYQWYHNGNIIPGATNLNYTIYSLVRADSGEYTCRVKSLCDSSNGAVVFLKVLKGSTHKISGFVTYDNSTQTPLTNTSVYLYDNQGNVLDSVETNSSGGYVFTNISDGIYYTVCTTILPWGGASPSDALLVNRSFIGINVLTDPMKVLAADVNEDKKVNPLDALLINRRYINVINHFKAPDWIFESTFISVNGTDVLQNIKAICSGNVKGDYSF